ncbi:MAG: extracellular solute-binding protein, partial [Armatimonadota bacterium]
CLAGYTDGHNNVYDFLIQLWSRGGVLFDEDWKPVFDGEIGCESLQYLADLFTRHKVVSPECLGMGSVECGNYYATGQAAMMWNWCGFAAVCEMPEYSQIVGRNICTTMPSVSLNIYWVLCLASRSQNKDLAYEFMQFVTSPAMDKVTSMKGANGTRLSTWRDPEVQAKYPHYVIIEQAHAKTRTLPAIPEFPELNELLSAGIHQVMHQGRPAAEALNDAARACEGVLRRTGRLA